jgi:hypothetical protein
MKSIIILSTLAVFLTTNVNAQTFTEITSDGWDMGIATSKPAIADLDGNDLLDMVIGDGSGILHHYEQNNNGSLEFTLITDNLSGINVSNYAAPQFTDFDDNGLLDLIIGQHNGTLMYYEQSRIIKKSDATTRIPLS